MDNYVENIGKRVEKCHAAQPTNSRIKTIIRSKYHYKQKKFKSGLYVNTVKAVIDHPILHIPAYTFIEDDSYVECRRCQVVNKYTDLQSETIEKILNSSHTIIITAQQGLGKTNYQPFTKEEFPEHIKFIENNKYVRSVLIKTLGYPKISNKDIERASYIQINTIDRTWRICFDHEWLYRNQPPLSSVDEIAEALAIKLKPIKLSKFQIEMLVDLNEGVFFKAYETRTINILKAYGYIASRGDRCRITIKGIDALNAVRPL